MSRQANPGFRLYEAVAMLPDISHDKPDDSDLDVPITSEQLARRQAIQQVGRRRLATAWFVYGNRPISESEIEREIDRQTGHPTLTADEKKVR